MGCDVSGVVSEDGVAAASGPPAVPASSAAGRPRARGPGRARAPARSAAGGGAGSAASSDGVPVESVSVAAPSLLGPGRLAAERRLLLRRGARRRGRRLRRRDRRHDQQRQEPEREAPRATRWRGYCVRAEIIKWAPVPVVERRTTDANYRKWRGLYPGARAREEPSGNTPHSGRKPLPIGVSATWTIGQPAHPGYVPAKRWAAAGLVAALVAATLPRRVRRRRLGVDHRRRPRRPARTVTVWFADDAGDLVAETRAGPGGGARRSTPRCGRWPRGRRRRADARPCRPAPACSATAVEAGVATVNLSAEFESGYPPAARRPSSPSSGRW